ncbi:CHAT domain protein [Ceratobasidium sp. AG-Ba]|nr:CHAT domain protein [Ceratobasidium sp. AG-Ba]
MELSKTADDPENKLARLGKLGDLFYQRFQRLEEPSYLDRAIDYHSQAVALIPDGHPSMLSFLNSLGAFWQNRFERLGELADIEKAIEYLSRAVKLIPDNHPNKPVHLTNLGHSWRNRFERLGEPKDISHAIECNSQANELTSDDNPLKSSCLDSLGLSWLSRFEQLGELAALNRSIECHSQAVKFTPHGHPNRLNHLNSLSISLMRRFERFRELENLDYAISCQSQVADLTPDDDSSKAGRMSNLGTLYSLRFEAQEKLADLSRAIECQSQAVALTPDDHPGKPVYVNNLGISWQSRFQRFGELADIDRAIVYKSRAVALTPGGHSDRPRWLGNLGLTYFIRFERLGELADINRAIECQSQAAALTPDDRPGKPSYLANLGNSLRCRFERLGELVDIDRAIEYKSQAVFLTPDDHPDRPAWLNHLGMSLVRRYERLGDLKDVDWAIECQSKAVNLTPNGDPRRPDWLGNLGNSWYNRFERLGEHTDINHAVEYHSQAFALTPDDHPHKPLTLSNLADTFFGRFRHLGYSEDLEKACNTFRACATTTVFKPKDQMRCAQRWARTCVLLNRSPLEAYQVAFSLLPRLIWIGQTIRHRYEIMAMVPGLAAQAAAWAISSHLYDLALEWLEQGRSVVWGQTLQLRTPFDDLFLVDSELAQKLRDVASWLDVAGSSPALQYQDTDFSANPRSQTGHHHRLALEWDELIAQARLLPGFENFMRPLKSKELKQAPKGGPIVVINIHRSQCDALIVLSEDEDIIHVPLPAMDQEKLDLLSTEAQCLAGQRGNFGDARGFRRDKAEENNRLLALIWSNIVEPVLSVLGYMEKSKLDELPHITWCTTGAMSFLPLHAAGLYDGLSPNASDLVVSSYTPTLTALLLHKKPSSLQTGLLAIGQEASPGQAALPKTVDELKIINSYTTFTNCHQLQGALATVSDTLAAMEELSWVHLACHATQNVSNPGQSAFHLHDGVLTLEEITRRKFTNKGLAFLSACQTAAGDRSLPDEATHLAAGMLVAGFPSVIATMWSIKDDDAPLIADIVYSELLKDGKMDHTRAARALHKAVNELRERVGEKEFWRWAPFVHIGV